MIPVSEHYVEPGAINVQLLKSFSFELQSNWGPGGPCYIDFLR